MHIDINTTPLQNLATVRFSAAQLQAIDEALDAFEVSTPELVALPVPSRRRMSFMGERSEPFCRQALHVLQLNPQVLPRGLSMDDAIADLAALDQLRPRLARLTRIYQRVLDTEAALGSDVMVAALTGYRLLKATGQMYGLAPLERELGTRFAKQGNRTFRKKRDVGPPAS